MEEDIKIIRRWVQIIGWITVISVALGIIGRIGSLILGVT